MIQVIDCSPDTSIISSYRQNPNLSCWKAIAEIVDNSFDAGAKRVEIEWDKPNRRLFITDDGAGCKDPEVMAKLGGSFRQASSGVALGRYGIGLKEASVWLCDRMIVTSSTDSGGWKIEVDWKKIEQTKKWSVPVDHSEAIRGKGVAIEMQGVKPKIDPTSSSNVQVLSEIFRPAILNGRQIVIQGDPIAALDLPRLRDGGDDDGSFEGKSFNVKYGIKVDASSAYGWTIAYGHRILVTNYTKAGFGEHSPSRFYGHITLRDTDEHKWSLNRFKDGFDGIDALLESLAPSIQPLLERAEAEGMDLEIKSAIGQVENDLNRAFGNKIKEKRPGCTGEEGTVEPKKTGRRRIEARNVDPTQPGSVALKGGKFAKFKVLFDWDKEGEIGNCNEQGKLLFIHLNPNHPRFLAADSRQQAMRECAVSLLCGYAAFTGNEQLLMQFDPDAEPRGGFDGFRSTLSNVLASVFGTQEEKATA